VRRPPTTTGTGVSQPAVQLAPIDWRELEPGLSEAKSQNKPAVAVFTMKGFQGPAAFDEPGLRSCLTSSGAIPIRVLPPEQPVLPGNATPEVVKATRESYEAACKKYRELAEKLGVSVNPTVLLFAPEGEPSCRLAAPSSGELLGAMGVLPTLVSGFWRELAPGLEEAKAGGKPAVIVFVARGYYGPATFASDDLRKVLGTSNAVPIRVLPPERSVLPKDATPEQAKEAKAAYEAAEKKHGELLNKYGVFSQPSMVMITPEGDVVARLSNPAATAVQQMLAALPKLVEDFKAIKARKTQGAVPAK